jgi:RNA polymerase sigma factor (sigma-70 family)
VLSVERISRKTMRSFGRDRFPALPGEDPNPMHNDSSTADLMTHAKNGDPQAWDEIVDRFAPSVWSICRAYRLSYADAQDVGQNVWMYLVNHLDAVRDPAVLGSWLATTTRRECSRVQRALCKLPAGTQEPDDLPDQQEAAIEDGLLLAERNEVLREAVARLPRRQRQLIALLTADPPLPYTEISARLGVAVGSIGPSRSRCLDRLRSDPAIAELIKAWHPHAEGENSATSQ